MTQTRTGVIFEGRSGAVFGFIGVIIGAIIPWIQSSRSEKRNENKKARYLAIHVVCILEKFVSDCAHVVADDGRVQGMPAGEDGTLEAQISTPTTLKYPEDVDWQSIDYNLMYRLLSLPNEIDYANRAIEGASEGSGPPDYEEIFLERHSQFSKLGLAAHKLEMEIREKYGIPFVEKEHWNAGKFFNDRLKEIEAFYDKRAESYAALDKEFMQLK